MPILRNIIRAIRISQRRNQEESLRRFGFWGWLALVCFAVSPAVTWKLFHLEQYRPPVGVYIAIVGGLAAAVTFRTEPTKREKALWILTITVLVVAEIAGLYKADSEQKWQFSTITTGLGTSINTLNTTISENRTHFDSTTKQLGEVVKNATGGDSFCYLDLLPGQTGWFMEIMKNGKYPLRNVHMTIIDETSLGSSIKTLESRPGMTRSQFQSEIGLANGKSSTEFNLDSFSDSHLYLGGFAFPQGDTQDLYILFTATNASWSELVKIKKVNGKWLKVISVFGGPAHHFSKVDKGYPLVNGDVAEWVGNEYSLKASKQR